MVLIVKTAIAPSNLACIKYWGKRDAKYNTPINSSVSVTLDYNDAIKTTTTCVLDSNNEYDKLTLNGKEELNAAEKNPRLAIVLQEMRKLAPPELRDIKVHIVSKNSFPTAAGLASSAAGYACMVTALAGVYGIDYKTRATELSRIARQGSGSACRSLHGGFVKWDMGKLDDGSDSLAVQIAPRSHWPELEALICVVSDRKKSTSSTRGMTDSVRTSELLAHRAAHVVPKRLEAICEAFIKRDFQKFAEITMRDSNQFHATCLDTYPPIFYLNDVSRTIIDLVTELNSAAGSAQFAYTFDAGPNAVIFTLKDNIPQLMEAILQRYYPTPADTRAEPDFLFIRGRTNLTRQATRDQLSAEQLANNSHSGLISYLYHTGIGDGACVLDGDAEVKSCLVDMKTGIPL